MNKKFSYLFSDYAVFHKLVTIPLYHKLLKTMNINAFR